MIREFEFYHGAALTRLIHGGTAVSIERYSGLGGNAAYVINNRVGLYIKYSANRLSPWTFTFKEEHQDEISEMKSVLNDVFVALVCRDDGIACLNYAELKFILDDQHEEVEWVRVSRRPREKYAVTGSDGKLKTKIGDNEYPSKVVYYLDNQ
jgi:hypothetical protein